MDDWVGFPKRSSSIIFTNDIYVAKKHSYNRNIFCVYPYNNTNIGICSHKDVLDPEVFLEDDYLFFDMYKDLKEKCIELNLNYDNSRKKLNESPESFKNIISLLGEDFYNKLKINTDPIKNNFKNTIMNWDNLKIFDDINISFGNELWTDGDCLFKLIENE